jgi:hypothetical protein
MKLRYATSLLLAMSSCSAIDLNRVAPGYIEAFQQVKGLVYGLENPYITDDLIKNIPYASSILQIGTGAPGLIILESKKSSSETWVSSDGVFLVIKKGKIIKTKGLNNNLVDSLIPKQYFKDSMGDVKFNFYLSYDEPKLDNLKVEATSRVLNKELVAVGSQEMLLTLVEETLSNSYLGWKVTNKYWKDENGFTWRSEQYISPILPPFIIQVTKKPAR